MAPPLTIYGVAHSPWTNLVAQVCHLKRCSYTNIHAPPLTVLLTNGITIPIAWSGSQRLSGSDAVVKMLDGALTDAPSLSAAEVYSEGKWVAKAEALFFAYAAGRMAKGPLHFLYCWSHLGSGGSRAHACVQAAVRPLMALYFCCLITSGVLLFHMRLDEDLLTSNLAWWATELERSGGPYMRGETLSVADLLLYAHLQTICSGVGTTGTALTLLRTEQHALLGWARRLSQRLAGFEWDFVKAPLARDNASVDALSPRDDCPGSSALERAVFWTSFTLATSVFAPLTATLLFYLFAVRNFNPNRSLVAYEGGWWGPPSAREKDT
uniref:GST N-terminal domain-containing protein n=1 Tax=Haptolina ericina TaxID=156174 RepID=A0A7S3AD90_9EUKA|mmetsp:Transcript_12873/g.29360  ORF Transcript_12873/g.29360 Transcript_12873/m.29360 type:complete len:324 (+) Transcript_12873:128-1099(+)